MGPGEFCQRGKGVFAAGLIGSYDGECSIGVASARRTRQSSFREQVLSRPTQSEAAPVSLRPPSRADAIGTTYPQQAGNTPLQRVVTCASCESPQFPERLGAGCENEVDAKLKQRGRCAAQ